MNWRVTSAIGLLATLLLACGDGPSAARQPGTVTISIAPDSVKLEQGERHAFVALASDGTTAKVSWSVRGRDAGSIDSDGVYTAPGRAGTFTVTATTFSRPAQRATATVIVKELEPEEPDPVEVTVDPQSARVQAGSSVTLRATVHNTSDGRVSWSVRETGGGAVDASGRYTAPETAGTYTVRATSVADSTAWDEAAIEVFEVEDVAVVVSPRDASLLVGEQQRFDAEVTGTADTRVTWSVVEASGGSIADDGTYSAPAVAGTFTVVATSVADPTRSDQVQVEVREPVLVRIDPREAQLEPGEQLVFTAEVTGAENGAVAWSVVENGGGTVDAGGTYTAPSTEGTFRVVATSQADPTKSDTATVVVAAPNPIDLSILPEDRRTTWNPGIPGGIPHTRHVFATLSGLTTDGTGDNATAIQQAIEDAGAAYVDSGVIQEVVLPAGTIRYTRTIALNRSGVVLRGQGMDRTKLRYDGGGDAIRIARNQFGSYTSADGPWYLAADGVKGSRQIVLSNADAANVQVGDILCIDEEDDPSFVRLGDARYEKRQANADTHGPALRAAGMWRSVTSMIQVTGKSAGASETTLTLAEPLHMSFRTSQYAQVFHLATEYSEQRRSFEGVHYSGLEDFYVTGGTIRTNNVAFCWISGLEVDGNPGTPNIGTYNNQGGISGRSVNLFHAYRFVVRDSYIHHSRSISQGGGAYLLSISSYTSESLIENNIIVFGNKLVVGNMMGGGNVIAYNYVDNARTSHATWQEGAIDLNHQAFTHNALVEGNWSTNLTSDTTHGNAGWHVFHRNYGTGQNSAPIYGAYPYTSGSPDGQYRRAAGTDGYHREATYIGNVLLAGTGTGVYQVDDTTAAMTSSPAVWRIGWGVDGGGGNRDDGTARTLLYRHGNWDSVTDDVVWDEANDVQTIPDSLYLGAKPAFFGNDDWPWIDPTGATAAERVKVLPAKARYDALVAP